MSVIPKDNVGRIEFCEQHEAPWTANAVPMGSSASAVSDFVTKTGLCRAAYEAQKAAQIAARNATNDFHLALAAMTTSASDIIKSVLARAATGGDAIYSLASIPVPATPSPAPAPGKPTDFKVQLAENGGLILTWECVNPRSRGTMYQVWRRIGTGEFTYCGGCGSKQFIDETIPAGTTNITYQLQGVRTTAAGPWAQYNVSFGGVGGALVTESEPTPIAA